MGNLYQELPEEVKPELMELWFRVSNSAPMIDRVAKWGA